MRYGKYLIVLLLGVLVFFGFLLSSIYSEVKRQIIEDLNAQQMVHARQAAMGIEQHMKQIVATLSALAHLPSIIDFDDEGIRTMAYYARSPGDEIRSVTRVDARGRIVYSLPYVVGTTGRDISDQEHIREIMRTHQPVVSDVFTAVQGFSAIAVHAPVFKDGKYDGTVAFLLSFDNLARRYIEGVRVGESGYAWVVTQKGVEISCPVPGHVGRSVFETSKGFPEILAMAGEMLKGRSGVATYHFDRVGARETKMVLKHAVYVPIPLVNTFWSLAVATPEDEIVSSLDGLRLNLALVTLSLLAVCVLSTFLLVRSQIVAGEQKKREAMGKALEESEALYRALIETTDTGYAIFSEDGTVVDANQEYVRLTGHHDLGQILGRSVLVWTAEQERTKSRKALEQCLGEGLMRNFEVDYVDAEGKLTPVEINGTVITREGTRKILAMCRDIKDRKKLEAQLIQAQKMESVGRLAGGVAHDFNNLLTVIIGYAEVALTTLDPADPLHHSLTEILRAGRHSAALTSQLLAFARKQIIMPRTLDLNDTVSGMLKMLQRLIGEGINLIWIPGHALWNVRIDPSQVDQILANLLVNARDAIAGTGNVTIETVNAVLDDAFCTAHLGSTPGEYVMLAVSDDGCGMDEDVLANVFEPFFTTKGVGEGTGLGLATVYGIVKQNQGFILISSLPTKGTTIKIYLPRFLTEIVEVSRPQREYALPGGSETILLVEDDEAVLNMAKSLLEGLGYTVLSATEPSQAVPLAEEHRDAIRLVITDVVMPGMNGKDLMERLGPIIPGARCLFISGYTANVIADHGVLEEGVSFMEKPFSVQTLAQKVRSTLDRL